MSEETKNAIKEVKKVAKNKTVTLCLIVKNETAIIKECLESMLPYIDRYDITDTGSTDGTPELIKEFFDEYGVPGEVYLSDWKGFGKSRTEALENCNGKAEYAWMIDADDKLDGDFKYPHLGDCDAVAIRLGRPDFSWFRNQIFKTGLGWEYIGVLHEYAQCSTKKPEECKIIKWGEEGGKYYINARTIGARNVGIEPKEKYSKDAEILLSALVNEEDPYYDPTNVRYQFYLAQSYFDSQQWEKSEEAYIKRIEMGGWEEEMFFSYFRVGVLKAIQQKEWPEIKEAFLEAWNFRPSRAEPFYEISRMYRSMDKPKLAYIYAKMGMEIPYPENDILFIAQDVYEWKMKDEFSSVAFYVNDFINGYHVTQRLLEENNFTEEHRTRINDNLKAYHQQVTQMQQKKVMFEEQMRARQKHAQLEEKLKKREDKKNKATTPKKGHKK